MYHHLPRHRVRSMAVIPDAFSFTGDQVLSVLPPKYFSYSSHRLHFCGHSLNFSFQPSNCPPYPSIPLPPPKNVIHQTSGWVTLITQTLPISPHYLKNQVQTLCISIKTEPFSALLYLHAHCTLSKPFFFPVQVVRILRGTFSMVIPAPFAK